MEREERDVSETSPGGNERRQTETEKEVKQKRDKLGGGVCME